MSDLDSLLNTSTSDIKAPQGLPAGSYKLRVGQHSFDESSQKKTPFVEFACTPVEAGEDVDEEELEEISNWREKTIKARFYLSPNAQFMLVNFLKACGVETDGKKLKELIPEVQGCEVWAKITKQAMQDGQGSFNPSPNQFFPDE